MSPSDYVDNAALAISTLQTFYNKDTGLWDSTGWWNSANCMTTLGNFASVHQAIHDEAVAVFSNTISAAQDIGRFVATYKKTKSLKGGLVETEMKLLPHREHSKASPRIQPRGFKGFVNEYYDDEGWWGLAWIKAYDVTKNPTYLSMAKDLFEDMTHGWNDGSCGGIFWRKGQDDINAIENELFISLASQLATRSDGEKSRAYYVSWAVRVWKWFQRTGMINEDWTINDGIDPSTCKNDGGTVWSYNQGVILGALVELDKVESDASYLRIATKIADAAIADLSDANGVLHDVCEPDCGQDGDQFKGVFVRNLAVLYEAIPQDRWKKFILANADSIWAEDRDETGNLLGTLWSGPYQRASAGTQSSATDALVAAATLVKNAMESGE